jgi:hypothetical protein
MAGTRAPVAGNELEAHRWRRNKAPHVFLPALFFPVQSRAPPALPRAPRDTSERNSAAELVVRVHTVTVLLLLPDSLRAPLAHPRTPVLHIHSERCFFFPAARTAKREESDCFSGQLHGCVGENRNAARERERGTDLIRGIQLFARFCERKKVDLFGEDAIWGNFWPPVVAAVSPLLWANARIFTAWRKMVQSLKMFQSRNHQLSETVKAIHFVRNISINTDIYICTSTQFYKYIHTPYFYEQLQKTESA